WTVLPLRNVLRNAEIDCRRGSSQRLDLLDARFRWLLQETEHLFDPRGPGFGAFGAFDPLHDVFAVAGGKGFEPGPRIGFGFQGLNDIRRQIADLKAVRVQHYFYFFANIELLVATPCRTEREKKSYTCGFEQAAIVMAVNGAGGVVTCSRPP